MHWLEGAALRLLELGSATWKRGLGIPRSFALLTEEGNPNMNEKCLHFKIVTTPREEYNTDQMKLSYGPTGLGLRAPVGELPEVLAFLC